MDEFLGLKLQFMLLKPKRISQRKRKTQKKYGAKKSITIQGYKNCLFNKTKIYRKMKLTRTYRHEI